MPNTPSFLVHLGLISLVAAACATEPDDVCIADRKLGANGVSLNGVSLNRLAANKLAANGVLGTDLLDGALTTESIADALDPAALQDELARDVLAYTVSCALADDQSIEVVVDGERQTFVGSLGLATAWGEADGACDETCQGWVSACLIARTNFEGVSRPISLLGDHPGLEPTEDESLAFDVEEATYFGELFGEHKAMYVCLPDGSDNAERTCGEDPAGCPLTLVGACSDVCDAAGCRSPEGTLFAQSITVNLPSSDASCD